MTIPRPLRFGIQSEPTDVSYVERRDYWLADELERFAVERQMPAERARHMVIAGTPEEVANALIPYIDIGFDMFLLMERAPLDYESLRLLMHSVAPRLREAAQPNSFRI